MLLLGIVFFNMIVLAIYTANLAAILSTPAEKVVVKSLLDVRDNGYKICAARHIGASVSITDSIVADLLLKDPNDGLPGLDSRSSVFDLMKNSVSPSERENHCEVALAPMEDFETLQGTGEHCNKTSVGDVLAFRQTGFPFTSRLSDTLWPAFQGSFNRGVYSNIVRNAKPPSMCTSSCWITA